MLAAVHAEQAEQLPAGYADLAPLLDWALDTENERHARRLASTVAQTRVLYDAMAPRMDAIVQYLQGFPIDRPLAPPDHRLFLLALSFIEVSLPIELKWKQTRNEGSYPTTRLKRPHRP